MATKSFEAGTHFYEAREEMTLNNQKGIYWIRWEKTKSAINEPIKIHSGSVFAPKNKTKNQIIALFSE